jgi:tetratricopeptide (TPR) repeat protein
VILPSVEGFVDAVHAGRFVVSGPTDEPYDAFGAPTGSLSERIAWLLSHPREAAQRLSAGQAYVARHHSTAGLMRFWLDVTDSSSGEEPSVFVERARGALAAHNLAEAEGWLSRAIEIDRALPEAYRLLGNVLQDQGKLDRAISSYRRALRLDPELAAAHNDLGTAYISKGWHDEAVAAYGEALRTGGDDQVVHANLARTLLKVGRRREARPHLAAALRLRLRQWMRRTL